MATKRELEDKAKALIENQPEEALLIYKELYEEFPEQFNNWDAFYTIKAMRGCANPDLHYANTLAKKYRDDRVGNVYGWLIFDRCIKGKTKNDIINFEKYIIELPQLCHQKNLRGESKIPCPTTISILKLCDAHAENLFNAKKINEYLSYLDYNLLSKESKKVESEQRGEVELASDLEKYFALKTKALIKLNENTQCIELCKLGLTEINNFHYNNDLWFKMRIALAEDGVGNHEESERIFVELLSSKAGGDKWFLYRDIAEVYFEKGEYSKAWKFAVDATFYGNEPHFLIGLYLLQARILFKLSRANDGLVLAELIAAIIKEQNWGDKEEYRKLFSYYKLDRNNVRSLNEVYNIAAAFWNQERFGNKSKITGLVVSISHNGKGGKIKSSTGQVVTFHKKDLIKKQKTIEHLKGAEVEFYQMESINGRLVAEQIDVKKNKEVKIDNSIVGKRLEATVVKIADFGVFLKLPNLPNGLLHKNGLPSTVRNDLVGQFPIGKKVIVVIDKVTEKGIQLKL